MTLKIPDFSLWVTIGLSYRSFTIFHSGDKSQVWLTRTLLIIKPRQCSVLGALLCIMKKFDSQCYENSKCLQTLPKVHWDANSLQLGLTSLERIFVKEGTRSPHWLLYQQRRTRPCFPESGLEHCNLDWCAWPTVKFWEHHLHFMGYN